MAKKIIMTMEKINNGFSAYEVKYLIFMTLKSIPEFITTMHLAVLK